MPEEICATLTRICELKSIKGQESGQVSTAPQDPLKVPGMRAQEAQGSKMCGRLWMGIWGVTSKVLLGPFLCPISLPQMTNQTSEPCELWRLFSGETESEGSQTEAQAQEPWDKQL